MTTPPAIAFTATQQFTDFDVLSSALRGWALSLDQLDSGPFSCRLTQIQCGPVGLQEGTFSRRVQQRGAAPRGCWTFGVPLSHTTRYRWRGRSIEADHVIGFDEGTEMESVSEPGFHILAVSIEKKAAARLCEATGLPPFSESVGREAALRCAPAELAQLRKFGNAIADHAKSKPNPIGAKGFSTAVAQTLPSLLAEAMGRSETTAFTPPANVRSKALRRALEAIHDRAAEPLSITELYRLSGASSRTVRYAFEEAFGIPPKTYLQAYRLNQVRRLLKNHEGARSGSISDIANDWGFWHMGQFAADYRKMFGELPSETLNGTNRTTKA